MEMVRERPFDPLDGAVAHRPGRAESVVQVVLMLAVGGVAAAASWAHVVSLATQHGQAGWLAVADAAVIETAAVSAGLEVRRRRRAGGPTSFVLAVLVVAVVLSLAAQVAEAERSVWGWTLAAIPAAGFLVLVKIALREVGHVTGSAAESTEHDQRPGLDEAAGAGPEGGAPAVQRQGSRGAEGQRGPATQAEGVLDQDRGPLPGDRSGTGDEPPDDDGGPLPDRNADALLAAGRLVLADLERDGVVLTRNSLVQGLRDRDVRVGTTRATDLLRALRAQNGHRHGDEVVR